MTVGTLVIRAGDLGFLQSWFGKPESRPGQYAASWSQRLVYAYVGHVYPASARGTAMGTASGVGRAGAISGPLIGGWLLTVGLAYPWGFYIFAVVAAIGAVCVALVNRNPAPDEPLPLTEDEADHIGLRH